MTPRTRYLAFTLSMALIVSVAACGGQTQPTSTEPPAQRASSTLPPAPSDTASPPAPVTLTPLSIEAAPTPSATTAPATVTPAAASTSWYPPGTLALVAVGGYEQADLYALNADGTTSVVATEVGSRINVSPAGRWLGFYRRDQEGGVTLELQDAQGGERRVVPGASGDIFDFAFDPAGRRLAYLDLGDYGQQGLPWALVVKEIAGDATSRYEALMVDSETRPLPGSPVGWSGAPVNGEELIFDTFVPGTEAGWRGVWGVALPAEGESTALESLPLRELVPGVPVYSSQVYLSPHRQSLAYLGRDPDYFPDNYAPEFYDLAVNRLEVTDLADGTRTRLLEVADGSALGRALAWSPDGTRLLFAQGSYEGESFVELSLKSTDLSGQVVAYGPLTLPPLGDLLGLAWCDVSLALYSTWNGSDGSQQLRLFDLNTGRSSEVLSGQRVEIVGCAP